MTLSRHAAERAQQRGIPPLILEWLQKFGEESFDGHGCIRRYFSKKSIRAMEREFGRRPVSKMCEYLRAYAIEATDSGTIVTTGWRWSRTTRR